MNGRSATSAMRLKCASAICGDWPRLNGAGGNTKSAEAQPSAAMRARRTASRLQSAQMPFDQRQLGPDSVLRDIKHAALLAETAGGDLGRVRVDGDGREAFDGGHASKVLAEARLVDGEIAIKWQQHRRDHAVRDIVNPRSPIRDQICIWIPGSGASCRPG